jgi:hypothetical protein
MDKIKGYQMNFKPKVYNILISIWAIMVGNMLAVGLILIFHQMQINSLPNLIPSKEDYYFRIITNFTIILMHLKICQIANFTVYTPWTSQSS